MIFSTVGLTPELDFQNVQPSMTNSMWAIHHCVTATTRRATVPLQKNDVFDENNGWFQMVPPWSCSKITMGSSENNKQSLLQKCCQQHGFFWFLRTCNCFPKVWYGKVKNDDVQKRCLFLVFFGVNDFCWCSKLLNFRWCSQSITSTVWVRLSEKNNSWNNFENTSSVPSGKLT